MKNVAMLATRLGRKLVFFDIEHTGYVSQPVPQKPRIIEFGAYLVEPDGRQRSYSSLVSVPKGTRYNKYAMDANKIKPRDLIGKPAWSEIYNEFAVDHLDAIWIGFNSMASDTPIIQGECQRCRLVAPSYDQFDLMKSDVIFSGLTGSLSDRLKAINPDVQIGRIHRALKDAWMTMALLEALLENRTGAFEDVIENFGVDEQPLKPVQSAKSVKANALTEDAGVADIAAMPAYIGGLVKKSYDEGIPVDEIAEKFFYPKESVIAYLAERGLLNTSLQR